MLQRANQIGKVVVSVEESGQWTQSMTLDSLVMTGGTGGLGLLVGCWLLQCGMSQLVLLSRSGNTGRGAEQEWEWLSSLGTPSRAVRNQLIADIRYALCGWSGREFRSRGTARSMLVCAYITTEGNGQRSRYGELRGGRSGQFEVLREVLKIVLERELRRYVFWTYSKCCSEGRRLTLCVSGSRAYACLVRSKCFLACALSYLRYNTQPVGSVVPPAQCRQCGGS